MLITNLHEQFCDYCETIKNYRPSTIKAYKSSIHILLKIADVKHIDEITEQVLINFFYQGRKNRNWTSTTVVDYMKSLNPFFKWCIKHRFIAVNPLDEIDKPKREKKLPKSLSIKDAFRLLEVSRSLPSYHPYIQRRNYTIIATFIYCGLRRKELLNLTLDDVNLEERSVSVRQGKGAKDRVVPIPVPLVCIFQEYLKERNKLGKSCYYFFASFRQDRRFTSHGLKRVTQQLKVDSGINFHVHMLRHTFATLMIEGGCNIYALSKMMGHSDISTTTLYLSASIKHLKTEIQKHPLQYFGEDF